MEVDMAVAHVQQLTDLELAMLLCLMSNNHGIIQTNTSNRLEALEQELKLSTERTFGMTATSFRCDAETRLEDFISRLLVRKNQHHDSSSTHADSLEYDHLEDDDDDNDAHLCIPNVVIVRDLQDADRQVQIQALELMRTGRVFTHTSVQTAPKHFLLLAINSDGSEDDDNGNIARPPRRLVNHLRDHMFLSHVHEAGDDFQRLEEQVERIRAGLEDERSPTPMMPATFIDALRLSCEAVTSTVEMTRYLNDVVVFLRMHRGVAGGTTPLATKHLIKMASCLAVMHDLPYVTPPFVAIATRKVFRHRLTIVSPANERSLQYGSEIEAVTVLLRNMTPEFIIEEVLDTVECPL